MKMAVFWVVAPCRVVEDFRRFRGTNRFHHQAISKLPGWPRFCLNSVVFTSETGTSLAAYSSL
jgi:hypothetical protein